MTHTEQSISAAFNESGRKSSRSAQSGNCVEAVALEPGE